MLHYGKSGDSVANGERSHDDDRAHGDEDQRPNPGPNGLACSYETRMTLFSEGVYSRANAGSTENSPLSALNVRDVVAKRYSSASATRRLSRKR
jgi:hypothetical protein